MAKQQHQWHYVQVGLINETEVGPISESELKKLAADCQLKADSKIMSPTRTKGKWIYLKSVPGLLKIHDAAVAKRQEEKAVAKEAKRQEKAAAKAESANAEPARVTKIREHVAKYLTPSETIQNIFVQFKPVAIKADAVVITDRRMMIVHPKLMGRFDFEDFLWMDLADAHISEDVLGSTFTVKHTSGEAITISMLPKDDGRKLYQIAQQREEEAIETRRRRAMEETAAGAAQVNVGAVSQPAAAAPANDPMSRVKQLKEMHDAGLIDDDEFKERKAAILAEI